MEEDFGEQDAEVISFHWLRGLDEAR